MGTGAGRARRAGRLGLTPPVIMADAGYGYHAAFRAGLTERGSPHGCQVEGDSTVLSGDAVPELWPYVRRGPRGQPRYRTRPVGLRRHALVGGRDATVELSWRVGNRRPTGLRPGAARPGGWPPTGRCRRPGCWPSGPRRLPSPPTTRWQTCRRPPPLPDLVRQDEIRRRIRHDYPNSGPAVSGRVRPERRFAASGCVTAHARRRRFLRPVLRISCRADVGPPPQTSSLSRLASQRAGPPPPRSGASS
ncbi:transposase [Geodermatophilus sp. URMC 65]